MEPNQNKSDNKNIIIGILILLLLISIGGGYYFYHTKSATIDTLNTQQADLQANFKSLSDTLDVKNGQIDKFKGKNAELDSTIVAKQSNIDAQKKQISSLLSKNKMTQSELAKAKDLIAQYVSSIADLQKNVADLTAQNQQLTQQNQQLSTDLSSSKQSEAQLSEQNKGLSQKVEVASLLQIPKVDVVGIKKTGKNKDKDEVEKKAKKVESLRITFETGANKVLPTGTLSLLVRIINPKGETIAVDDQGSGTFQSADGNGNVQYSKKADIDWDQTNKKVVVYWSSNINSPGIYKVELYQSGHEIGKGEVDLK